MIISYSIVPVRSRLNMCRCMSFPRQLGQIELYTHVPVMRRVVEQLHNWNFRVCGVFLVDAQFCVEQSKFLSGMLTALSSMIQLEIPFIHVLSKVDLLSKRDKKRLKK